MAETVPSMFGKCKVSRLIGQGATAVVYLARHEGLDIPVAVKVLKKRLSESKPQYADRFLREARMAARLEHPNIVRVIDCGVEDGYHFMVMDYVDGPNCLELLDDHPGGLHWREATRIVRQAAVGLAYAAGQGLIHRDVKPSNIMIDSSGRARVSDLGLAKLTIKGMVSLTQELHTVGTPNYMSPEQIRSPSDLDMRTDVYSLGATLYHMVCGRPPYSGSTSMEVVAQHLSATLTPPYRRKPGLPAPLSSMICKMMAKSPDERYQSYDVLCADLDSLLEGKATSAEGFEESGPGIREDEVRKVLDELAFGEDMGVEDLEAPAPALAPAAAPVVSAGESSSEIDPFGPADYEVYKPGEPEPAPVDTVGESTELSAILTQSAWDPRLVVVLVVLGVLALIAVAVFAVFSTS